MDRTEKKVSEYLDFAGMTNWQFEPDGNVPPDFLVNGIAIEVRRLNQHHFTKDAVRGLEVDSIPLIQRVTNLIASINPPIINESWFVFIRFSRPLGKWKLLQKEIYKALNNFLSRKTRSSGSVIKNENFELDLTRASKIHSATFIFGGYSDDESGGWLIDEMQKNIAYCIDEKTKKINSYKSNYQTWWLALVDYIGYGLDDFDREQFMRFVSIEHDWDKVILVDPNDLSRTIEI